MQTLIVCLGDEQVCDDGIGARVGRILQLLSLPSDVKVIAVNRMRIELFDALAEAENLILVDNMLTNVGPGTCSLADVTEIPAGMVSECCSHGANVAQIIELAWQISCDGTLREITMAGIEGKQSNSYGVGFSDEVLASVPRLVDMILRTIGARLETRNMVKDACLKAAEQPSGTSRPRNSKEVHEGRSSL
jgi:hydrogenase maturation protease